MYLFENIVKIIKNLHNKNIVKNMCTIIMNLNVNSNINIILIVKIIINSNRSICLTNRKTGKVVQAFR